MESFEEGLWRCCQCGYVANWVIDCQDEDCSHVVCLACPPTMYVNCSDGLIGVTNDVVVLGKGLRERSVSSARRSGRRAPSLRWTTLGHVPLYLVAKL
ncbi:hypothetical protein KVT40_002732 [Elsinoe batatas]|uniref:Uncharacterized protein n=1 Tax=Elsinoe batatas TaxID=2601811 RepID=A0A8K0L497_9PEZI|nr:hypothetical protein KVT40_002732 [Elsinoe batatas]